MVQYFFDHENLRHNNFQSLTHVICFPEASNLVCSGQLSLKSAVFAVLRLFCIISGKTAQRRRQQIASFVCARCSRRSARRRGAMVIKSLLCGKQQS